MTFWKAIPLKYLLFTIFSAGATLQCLSQETNQLGLGEWKGIQMGNSEEVRLADLPHQVLALNVYSTNCVPCWKELPALHRIQERFKKDKRFGLYLIVDPWLIVESSKSSVGGSNVADVMEEARAIMKREIKERNISIPILFMKPPFRITDSSFVTGTPETLLVRTNPWNIFYNFIGAISEKESSDEIDRDPKVKFFFSMIGGRDL